MLWAIFERFTDRARYVLVLAQEEARLLNHGFIGTEHILLGLIAEGGGLGAVALAELDVTLEATREAVEEIIGLSGGPSTGSPPFTPRAKKVMELSLREALALGHNYIGTEHLLLGLVREGEGVAAQILTDQCGDLAIVRQHVLTLLTGQTSFPTATGEVLDDTGREPKRGGRWGRFVERPRSVGSSRFVEPPQARIVRCSFCGRRPPASGRLVQGGRAFICEHCVKAWSERLTTEGGEGSSDPTTSHLYKADEENNEEDSDG